MIQRNLESTIFDYTFLGLGCGNSLLLFELDKNGLLYNKSILIIDPIEKIKNDKTFCFWLEPELINEYDLKDLVRKEWGKVCAGNNQIQSLGKYKYYHIPSLSLYNKVARVLSKYNVKTIQEEFTGNTFQNGELISIRMPNNEFQSRYVFDNRPPEYAISNKLEIQIYQSFYGWEIKTQNKKFDSDTFTMMDFEIPQDDATQFMYILPYAENHALFEITRFGEKIIEKEEAEQYLKIYLESKEIDFRIEQTESGVIRMFNTPAINIQKESNIFNTGERGGSLKPSTGYSFIRSLYHAKEITKSLITADKVNKNQTRFSYYDRLLLQILKNNSLKGKDIFTNLFSKNNVENVLTFLDERSTPREEITIFKSLPIKLFVIAAYKDCFWMLQKKFLQIPIVIWMSLTMLFINLLDGKLMIYTLLFLGMLLIGIPHGALDHLFAVDHNVGRKLIKHFIIYIGLGLLVLLLFWLSPIIGLIFFLIFSCWHFGETDFTHWRIKNKGHAFVWGIYCLGALLLSHLNETQLVIREMHVNMNVDAFFSMSLGHIWIILGGIYFLFWKQKSGIFYGILTLFILQFVPLIAAFSVFFIGQHSLHGWTALKENLNMTHVNLWIKAFPFTLGAFFLFAVTSFFTSLTWGELFIFLAALSFPHVFFTSKATQKQEALTRN